MTLSTNSARANSFARPAQPARARIQPRHINFLTLAQQMSADTQLHQALEIPGTALLGVATDGVPLMVRLASPDVTHVLISGARASGKTEMVRTLLASIALYQKPRDIQFLALDLKGAHYEFLANTPHLLGDIATTPERALQHVRWLESELDRREEERVTRPRLVVMVDEIGELLSHAGREFQVHLARLAQRGRNAGISLVVCTSKANGSDMTPNLRAGFPVRLIGKNNGAADGSDKLAGRGDFILSAGGERVRFQAAYLAPEDIIPFHAQARANLAQPDQQDNSLGGIVRRLRRK